MTRRTTPRGRRTGTGATPRLRVRMYRQGLGDCFLLTFQGGPAPVHMLIDFGSIGEKTTGVTLADVADNIVTETGGHLHLLVATHEHQDHVNGFLRQRDRLAKPGFTVDRVWQAWTEDGADELAQQIETRRGDLLEFALGAVAAAAARRSRPPAGAAESLRGILGFVGDAGVAGQALGARELAASVQEAMNWVTNRADNTDKFLHPGSVIEPEWLPGVRFYVLGPPRDPAAINRLGAHGDKELYELAERTAGQLDACARFAASGERFARYIDRLDDEGRRRFNDACAFDPRFRIEASGRRTASHPYPGYDDPALAWRRIDSDWMGQATDLALQLDNATNNTSLVLAIEFIDDGRVLLFPGDAQKGNWESWEQYAFEVRDRHGGTRTVRASDLLKRTVFYKVGHHSSHNATLKARGLELMRHPDLVAFIPLDAAVAGKKWPTATWPATGVYEALLERARGRVLRSDTDWPPADHRPASISKTDWTRCRKEAVSSGLVDVKERWIDYTLR